MPSTAKRNVLFKDKDRCSVLSCSIYSKFNYHQASPFIKITDGIIMWAAARVIIATSSRLKRTASPVKAEVPILVDTAACASLRTCIVVITNSGGFHWRWRRWAGVWRVGTSLDGIRGFNGDPTFSSGGIGQIPLKLDVAILSPTGSPWIPHDPVIYSIFSAISHSNNTMV